MTIPTIFVQDAPSKMDGVTFVLGANQFRRFPGGPVGQHRKQIVITNEDNTDKLYIAMTDDETSTGRLKVMTIFPNGSITLFTNAEVILYSGSAIVNPVQVLEIFYTGAGNLVV